MKARISNKFKISKSGIILKVTYYHVREDITLVEIKARKPQWLDQGQRASEWQRMD